MQEMFEQFVDRFNNQPFVDMSDVPSVSGIYGFFHDGELMYIGESKNLADRMTHHRNGNGSKLKQKMESVEYFIEQFKVKFLPIDFGRLEVEEYLIKKYCPLFNNFFRKRKNAKNKN